MAETSGTICKRARKLEGKEEAQQVYLPEELIFNILFRLPASLLNDVMRYICPTWHRIISSPGFRRAHLEHSTCTTKTGFLFVQRKARSKCVYFVQPISTSTGNVMISKSNINFPWPSTSDVWDTYDGICIHYVSSFRIHQFFPNFYVANPVTKQKQTYSLPPLCSRDPVDLRLARSSSGQYKAVCVCRYRASSPEENCGDRLAILDIGINIATRTWRTIPLEVGIGIDGYQIVSTDAGFLYVVMKRNIGPDYKFLAIDLDSEVIHKIANPPCYSKGVTTFFPKGRRVTGLDYNENMKDLTVWTLNKSTTPKHSTTWCWTLLCKCDLELATSLRKPFVLLPLAWFEYGKLLVFGSLEKRNYVVLDVCTAKTTTFSTTPAFYLPDPTLVPYVESFLFPGQYGSM